MASSTKKPPLQANQASTTLLRNQGDDYSSYHKSSTTIKGNSGPNLLRKDPPQSIDTSSDKQKHQSDYTVDELAPVAHHSPWKNYQRLFKVKFGDAEYFTVAEKFLPSANDKNSLVIIKSFLGHRAQNQIQSIQKVRDASFVTALEIFKVDDGFSVVFEFMHMSLSEIAGNPLLNELRVASILGQVDTAFKKVHKSRLTEDRFLKASNT
ncbi:hypothetical protein QBC46DRAFT_410348 [Diplogelasinospora grovesii]|uniref:Protein kinase domain-containing protein n=1 Tax=Diplogelasinospora grovesii TaxID=303347 RepID=A0AAN6S2N2_9PEZI|nr:hypothetical protein QBC46DRAFT_410348 [Diplogelasinospora grovesii]